MHSWVVALAIGLGLASEAGAEGVVLVSVELEPSAIDIDVEPLGPIDASGVGEASYGGVVARVSGDRFVIDGPRDLRFVAEARFEHAVPTWVPFGSMIVAHQSGLEGSWTSCFLCPGKGTVTSTLTGAAQALSFNSELTPSSFLLIPAFPGDRLRYQIRFEGYPVSPSRPSRLELDLRLMTPASAVSGACRADLNDDGAVNFADLARMRSVFFQTCGE